MARSLGYWETCLAYYLWTKVRGRPTTNTNLDMESLVGLVKQHRKDTSAAEKARRSAKAIYAVRSWIVAIVISYVDLAGDVAVGSALVQSDTNQRAGYITLGLTGFSQVMQATISMAMGQGPAAAFAALVGAKPLLGALPCKSLYQNDNSR